MDLKWVIVMVVGFAVILMGKKNTTTAMGKTMVIVGSLISIIGAIFSFSYFLGSDKRVYNTENRYRYVQSRILCDHAKKVCSPSKVCIIVSPNSYLDTWGDLKPQPDSNAFVEAALDAFGKGCEVEVLYPEYKSKKPDDPHKAAEEARSKIPYPALTAKDYKKLCEKIKKSKPDCIVNAYEFPKEQSLANSLKELKGYKVAFFSGEASDKKSNELTLAFQDGGKQIAEIIGVVLKKENYDFYKEPSNVDRKAFDVRFVLATQEDFSQALKEASAK